MPTLGAGCGSTNQMAAVIASKAAHTSTIRAARTRNTGSIHRTCRPVIRGNSRRNITIGTADQIGIAGTMSDGVKVANRSGGKMNVDRVLIALRAGNVIIREIFADHPWFVMGAIIEFITGAISTVTTIVAETLGPSFPSDYPARSL